MPDRDTPPMRTSGCECPELARLGEPAVTARLMVVVAHPDDETIGAGGLLARCTDAHVVIISNGAPSDRAHWATGVQADTTAEYATIRENELRRALANAGIGSERIHLLGITDCEVTTQLPLVIDRLSDLVDRLDPEIVLTSPYEGGHVDHDGTALAVHVVMTLRGRGHAHELALYHADGAGIAVHEFLPADRPELVMELDAASRARKDRMLACYASQRQYSTYFATDIERYRCAPRYDFHASPTPHSPRLYERANPSAGEQWHQQAGAVLDRLDSLQAGPDLLIHDTMSPTLGRGAAPLVSVIVRTVGRKTLAAALDSINCQTHPAIEIVVVDAGSHGLPSWCAREGVSVRICTMPGSNRPVAANAGLAGATGDYVAFLDDDDWYHPEHLASLVAALESAPDAKVAYCGVELIECLDDRPPQRRWVFNAPYDAVALLCENYIPLNAVLVERRLLLDSSWHFDSELSMYEDWDYLIWLSRRTRFERVPTIGAVYRWPPGSGVNDPTLTGAAQERIFSKWRSSITPEEHAAIMRRAIAQTTLNDNREGELRELRSHVKLQDDELARARAVLDAEAAQRTELQTHLRALDADLSAARRVIEAQEQQLSELRPHLQSQDRDLDRARSIITTRDQELAQLREHLRMQDDELARLRHSMVATDSKERLDALDLQLAAARERIIRMRESWSWRLTKPLRSLGAFLLPSRVRHD